MTEERIAAIRAVLAGERILIRWDWREVAGELLDDALVLARAARDVQGGY